MNDILLQWHILILVFVTMGSSIQMDLKMIKMVRIPHSLQAKRKVNSETEKEVPAHNDLEYAMVIFWRRLEVLSWK